jgi:hypothetical protein
VLVMIEKSIIGDVSVLTFFVSYTFTFVDQRCNAVQMIVSE